MLNNKRVLITGGTGSFGKKFIETILAKYPEVKNIIIFYRDELKQSELRKKYPPKDYPQLRFFIGDVRDRDRLTQAAENVDVIIHAAAIKQVDTAEYNPTECIRTNLDGAENVIHAALHCGVKDIVLQLIFMVLPSLHLINCLRRQTISEVPRIFASVLCDMGM